VINSDAIQAVGGGPTAHTPLHITTIIVGGGENSDVIEPAGVDDFVELKLIIDIIPVV
jgi:hypothetical protein